MNNEDTIHTAIFSAYLNEKSHGKKLKHNQSWEKFLKLKSLKLHKR